MSSCPAMPDDPGRRRLRFAGLPNPAILADLDVVAAGIGRKPIEELGTCRYRQAATNIVLIGPAGTGKMHRGCFPSRRTCPLR